MQNYVEFLPSTILSLKPKVICIMVELDPEKKKNEEGRVWTFLLHHLYLCKHSIHQVDLCKKVTKQWSQKMLPVWWQGEASKGLSVRHFEELPVIF